MQLIVLGMHRSGTSALTRVLNLMGAYVGPEGSTTGANEENPKGFWERKDMRAVCDRALAAGGGDWWRVSGFDLSAIPDEEAKGLQQEFAGILLQLDGHRPWVIKEPRLCVLFGLFAPTFEAPIGILTYRDPVEIAMSLRTRNGLPLPMGVALWERYTRDALATSVDIPRLLLRYADLLADPVSTVHTLFSELTDRGVTGLRLPSDAEITAYINSDLYRQRSSDSSWGELLTPEQIELARSTSDGSALRTQTAAMTQSGLQLLEALDEKWKQDVRLQQSNALVTELREELSRAQEDNRTQQQENKKLHGQVVDTQARLVDTEAELAETANDLKSSIAEQGQLRAKEKDLRQELASTRRERDDVSREYRLLRNARSVRMVLPVATKLRALAPGRTRSRVRHKPAHPAPTTPHDSAGEPPAESTPAAPMVPAIRPFDIDRLARLEEYSRVTVIMPIYNAHDAVAACLRSVMAHTAPPHRLLLVDDASTDDRIPKLLAQFEGRGVEVLRNPENLGYTRTVNLGIAAAGGDVVLLNSDTQVPPRWLDHLLWAATSEERVATVTPLSNNAGAFSAPLEGFNAVPEWGTLDQIGRAVSRSSRREYPSSPTGNGFCMFISRKAIEEVGTFDEQRFPRGYGEENDFCMRAQKAGWANLIADDTYVLHQRSASFGAEKAELIESGRRHIDELHPTYTADVRAFFTGEELAGIRRHIGEALAASPAERPCVRERALFVLHEGSGGTPATNLDLMRSIAGEIDCYVLTSDTERLRLARLDEGELRETHSWALQRPWVIQDLTRDDYRAIYASILTHLDIDFVHIRHLLGHTLDLPSVAHLMGVSVVVSFHDFYMSCPTVHLLDNNDEYCGGTCTPGDGVCRVPSNWLKTVPHLKHAWVHTWRDAMAEAFTHVDAFVTTSRNTKDTYLRSHPALDTQPFHVIEHGRDLVQHTDIAKAPSKGGAIKLLIPGNININKGADFITDLHHLDIQGRLELHFLGNLAASFQGLGVWHGPYQRDEFATEVKKIGPAFIGVFSIWPETYAHTITEAWGCGVPVLATDIGVLRDRVTDHGGGWLLDHTDPKKAYDEILRIADDSDEYERVRSQAHLAGIRSVDDMGFDYRAVYADALLGRRLDGTTMRSLRVAVLGKTAVSRDGALLADRLPHALAHPGAALRLTSRNIDSSWVLAQTRRPDLDIVVVDAATAMDQGVGDVLDALVSFDVAIVVVLTDALRGLPPPQSLLDRADLITVPTDKAREVVVPKTTTNIAVVPQQLNERLWLRDSITWSAGPQSEPLQLLYLNLEGQPRGLELLKEVVAAYGEEGRKRVELSIVGGREQDAVGNWCRHVPIPSQVRSYRQLAAWLSRQRDRWHAGVIPLEESLDRPFNSDIEYLELTAMGLPVACSDAPLYAGTITHELDGLLASSISDWTTCLTLLEDGPRRQRMWQESWDQVSSARLLKDHAGVWVDVLWGACASHDAAVN